MFLMGMVVYDEATKAYVPVGESEFNEEMRKKALSKNMKVVRQVVLNTLSDGAGRFSSTGFETDGEVDDAFGYATYGGWLQRRG